MKVIETFYVLKPFNQCQSCNFVLRRFYFPHFCLSSMFGTRDASRLIQLDLLYSLILVRRLMLLVLHIFLNLIIWLLLGDVLCASTFHGNWAPGCFVGHLMSRSWMYCLLPKISGNVICKIELFKLYSDLPSHSVTLLPCVSHQRPPGAIDLAHCSPFSRLS